MVTGLAAVAFKERCHRTRALSVIGLKVAFVDELAPLRRDIAVIGLYSFLFEPIVADKVAGILPEHLFVKLLEGGSAVNVGRIDSGLVVVTAVAGGSLGEPRTLALRCIGSSQHRHCGLPPILKGLLEATVKWRRKCPIRHQPALCGHPSPVAAALFRGAAS